MIGLIVFSIAAPSPAVAQQAPPVEHTLRNGLKVLILEDHKSPLSIFQIWYRVGAVDEVSGRTGLSHVLEHMMFKGTRKFGTKVLSRTVQKNGGVDNAFTSKDYTAYFQLLPSDRIDLSLMFESDRMQNLVLDPGEMISERNVVMEERRLRSEDDPQSALYELTLAAAFNVHPYGRPVIGWMGDLEQLRPDDLRAHYRKYYSPDNAVIVAVGDLDPSALLRDIDRAFGHIPRYDGARERRISQEPTQAGQRRVYLRKEAQLPYVFAVFHVPRMPHDDSYALDVLSQILSGGKSGRLYRELVYEKKLALGAYAANYSVSRDPFIFIMGASATPGTGADALEAAMFEQLDALSRAKPSEFELQKAKNGLEAEFIMQQDSIYYQAMILGQFEMAGDWRMRDSYIEKIRKVTADDVMRVAKDYLTVDKSTVGVLVPINNSGGKGE